MVQSLLEVVLSVDNKKFYKHLQWNLLVSLFCQLSANMCLIVPPPVHPQGAPQTCVALTEQFDLSPCVVIGGAGVVIHGPFHWWHVKCSVLIPEAESGFAESFVFSCLTFDLNPSQVLMHL